MKLCIVTGEASGDLHTAGVVRELKKLDPGLKTFGIGGVNLGAEGMELLHDVRELAIVGLFNVLRHIPMYRRVFRGVVDTIRRDQPDAILLVDFPDFNLRMAKKAKEAGLRVFYYIAPQLWAWRKNRVRQVAKYVDHVLVIFPFEEDFFRSSGVPVTYVGHPLVEQLENVPRARVPLAPGRNARVALLPGSRRSEIEDLFPPMLEAVRILSEERGIEPFVVRAPTIDHAQLDAIMDKAGLTVDVIETDGPRAVASADIAMASSGTATLEAAILGVPTVVMYRLTPMTYALARRLVKLPNFSLVNIVAGRRIVPELLQDEVSASRIADEARELLDPENHARIVRELDDVRDALGASGASRKAAETIYRLVGRK